MFYTYVYQICFLNFLILIFSIQYLLYLFKYQKLNYFMATLSKVIVFVVFCVLLYCTGIVLLFYAGLRVSKLFFYGYD